MTGLQIFFWILAPLLLAVGGVFAGERFIRSESRKDEKAPLDQQIKTTNTKHKYVLAVRLWHFLDRRVGLGVTAGLAICVALIIAGGSSHGISRATDPITSRLWPDSDKASVQRQNDWPGRFGYGYAPPPLNPFGPPPQNPF